MDDRRSRLSVLERVLRVFTDIRAGEGPTSLVLFANVFLILCAYYFIKPLREGWLAASGTGGQLATTTVGPPGSIRRAPAFASRPARRRPVCDAFLTVDQAPDAGRAIADRLRP